jgi:hypothetical protein
MSRTAVLELVSNGVVVRLNDHERTSTYVTDLNAAIEIVRVHFSSSTGITSRITRPVSAIIAESDALEPNTADQVPKRPHSDCYQPHVSTTLQRPPPDPVAEAGVFTQNGIPTRIDPAELSLTEVRSKAKTVRWARPPRDAG